MNAQSEPQSEGQWRIMVRAVNNSWLRHPLLVMTVLAVAALTLKAMEMTQDILAAVEPVAEWFNLPF